jgi:hypothetical protein
MTFSPGGRQTRSTRGDSAGRIEVLLSEGELQMLQDALWAWCASPAGPRHQAGAAADDLRRRLLRLDLVAKGWGPAEDALADLLPEST